MQIIENSGNKIRLVGINEDVNLCDLKFSCNGGVFVVKDKYFETKNLNENGFKINNPTRFSSYLTTKEYMLLNQELIEAQKSFKVEFFPVGYMKDQAEAYWCLTLEFGYEIEQRIPKVKLIDFGNSFGDLMIDDIKVGLSHGGGSTYDFTDTWFLNGSNKYKAMKYLVNLLTKKIVFKAA